MSAEAAAPAVAWRARRLAGAPLAVVRVVLAGGARAEPIPGLGLVAGRALAEGTRRRDWRALAAAAEARGMTAAGFGTLESTGVAVDALAGDWREAVDLAAEMLLEPIFPVERIAWLTRQAAAELEAQADEADVLTGRAFARLLYGEHPKGRPLQGDAESLARITDADCARFHAAALARGGCVVLAGEIPEDEARERLAARFTGLAPPRRAELDIAPPPGAASRRREVTTRAHDQAHLFVGQLTVARDHEDCAALELAAVILGAGSGLSGRIPQRIRDREGLAYHAAADAVAGAGLDAGRLVAYVGTAPERLAQAERGVVEELERLLESGVTDEEVAEARSYLLGREPFRRETARQWADLAALGALEGLPFEEPGWALERIAAPGRADVERALRKHVDPDRLTVAVGLPEGD